MSRNIGVRIGLMTLYLGIFLGGISLGISNKDTALDLLQLIFGGEDEALEWGPIFILIIFFRNLATATLILASAPLLGVFAAASMFVNGFVVGGVILYSTEDVGRSLLETLALILPHGVIEIPALLYASALSLELGFRIVMRRVDKEYLDSILERYIRIVAPLLLIAAIIETFITPIVGELVRNLA